MAQFTLEIECDNAAFSDEDGVTCSVSAKQEVGRILAVLARKMERSHEAGDDWAGILDSNGNRVGGWNFSE